MASSYLVILSLNNRTMLIVYYDNNKSEFILTDDSHVPLTTHTKFYNKYHTGLTM